VFACLFAAIVTIQEAEKGTLSCGNIFRVVGCTVSGKS